jgi:hypothetical protein
MQENLHLQQNNVSEKREHNIDRIPFKERMEFQKFLMEEIGFSRGKNLEAAEEWAIKNAEKVSDIIDNISREDNKIIRPLIMKGDYKEASKYVLKALEESEKKEMVYH